VQIASLGNGPAVNTGVARRDAPNTADQAGTQPPNIKFSSPTLKYDPQSRLVIFQVLNPDTGDVVRQYPSQRVVKLYQDGSGLAGEAALIAPIAGVDPKAGKETVAAPGSAAQGAGLATSVHGDGQSAAPAGGAGQPTEEPKTPSVKITA
jgi:hypothetical protein